MDFIMNLRLIQAFRKGAPPDMDVYDGVALSVIVDLTGRSVAAKSRPVDFPDFTRGMWKEKCPLEVDKFKAG